MQIRTAAAAFAIAGAAVAGLAGPASATEHDGNCDGGAGNGEFCVLDINGQTCSPDGRAA